MEDYLPNPDLFDSEPKFQGVNWNGLILAPTLQCLILMLPHLSNYIKVVLALIVENERDDIGS